MRIRRTHISNPDTNQNYTHIEVHLQCEYCKNPFWAKKKNSKFCRNACRQAAYRLK